MSYRTDNRAQAADVQAIPAPPKECGTCGADCTQPHVGQVLLVVVERSYRQHVGRFLEFCNESFDGHGKCARSPKPGVEFVSWLSRCARCYQRDLDRTKRGKWNYTPTGYEPAPEFLTKPQP